MTIHNLEVHPGISASQLKKLARRYAMTGGFELSLKEGLTPLELEQIAEEFTPELAEFSPGESRFYSCNAFRILRLLLDQESLPDTLRQNLSSQLEEQSQGG